MRSHGAQTLWRGGITKYRRRTGGTRGNAERQVDMESPSNSTGGHSVGLDSVCGQIFKDVLAAIKEQGGTEYCPAVYDGVMCWPPALSGTTVRLSCPASFEGATYNALSNASRFCDANGTWANRTDYSPCILKEGLTNGGGTLYLQTIFCSGYCFSLLSLLIALLIFQHFRSLHCLRNYIHAHLMVTLVIRVVAWLTLYGTTRLDTLIVTYLYNATTSVQAWASLAMLCWMFVEGAYLLNIVYWTFRLHQVRIWHYALFGWGIPAIFVSIWTTIHAIYHPNTRWIEQSQDFYLISLPSLIILSSNALVLIFIIYSLIFRLKAPKNASPSFPSHDLEVTNTRGGKSSWFDVRRRHSSNRSRFRLSARFNRSESMKSLKACLTLIPLLGIPQVIFIVPYHPSVVQIFTYVNAVVTSTQGFWVALIYCFLNEEVRLLLRGTLQKVLLRKHLRRHRQSCQTSGRPRQRSTLDLTNKFVVVSGRGASSTNSDIDGRP